MKANIRKETLELVCYSNPAPGSFVSNFYFPDNELLRNVKLWGIQTYYLDIFKSSLSYPVGQYPNLPTRGQFKRMFLNLYDTKDNNFCKDAPFPIFQSIENGTMRTNKYGDQYTIQEKDFKVFTGQKLNLQKSFLSIVDTQPVKLTAVVDFYYSRIDLDKI